MEIPPGPILPGGYDYANAHQVTIEGVTGITYVAYKLTGNTNSLKEAICLYYSGTTFKNFMKTKWEKTSSTARYITYYVPHNNFAAYTKWRIFGDGDDEGVPSNIIRIQSVAECGEDVLNCFDNYYSNRGWVSLGFIAISFVNQDLPFAVIAACMLDCALGNAI